MNNVQNTEIKYFCRKDHFHTQYQCRGLIFESNPLSKELIVEITSKIDCKIKIDRSAENPALGLTALIPSTDGVLQRIEIGLESIFLIYANKPFHLSITRDKQHPAGPDVVLSVEQISPKTQNLVSASLRASNHHAVRSLLEKDQSCYSLIPGGDSIGSIHSRMDQRYTPYPTASKLTASDDIIEMPSNNNNLDVIQNNASPKSIFYCSEKFEDCLPPRRIQNIYVTQINNYYISNGDGQKNSNSMPQSENKPRKLSPMEALVAVCESELNNDKQA